MGEITGRFQARGGDLKGSVQLAPLSRCLYQSLYVRGLIWRRDLVQQQRLRDAGGGSAVD